MKILLFISVFVFWMVIGIIINTPATTKNGHEERFSCVDIGKDSIKCTEETTGREWMMIKEIQPPIIKTSSDIPYREADLKYITCSFTSKGVFFCVNTRTGKIWTPGKKGYII